MKVRITEYLEIDLEREQWCCQPCGHPLISARESYKKGCLVSERPLADVHPPLIEGQEYSILPRPGLRTPNRILLSQLRDHDRE